MTAKEYLLQYREIQEEIAQYEDIDDTLEKLRLPAS